MDSAEWFCILTKPKRFIILPFQILTNLVTKKFKIDFATIGEKIQIFH
jgi:hypothetical protein